MLFSSALPRALTHRASTKRGIIRRLAAAGLDLLFPPRCLSCEAELAGSQGLSQAALCPPCWSRVTFITDPACVRCGLPFDYAVGPEAVCAACAQAEPPFDRARAPLAYDRASRPLLVGLKHGKLHGLTMVAGWMLSATPPLADTDLLCPVPLHRRRLLARGYNQAALLAQSIARASPAKVAPDLLVRRRATASQGGLSRSGRRRNVQGAFAVHPRWKKRVQGASIVLVDDVFTTGATIGECCRVLRRAGAASVQVLCAARVVQAGAAG